MRRLLAVALGIAFLTVVAGSLFSAPSARAATGLHYVRGYSVQTGWLCYGYSNGAYHCTQHWAYITGRYVSYNPAWVPSQSPAAPPAAVVTYQPVASTTATSPVRNGVLNLGPCAGQPYTFPASIGQWTVPSGCYAGVYPASHSPARPSPGWCNELPEVLHPWLTGYNALHLPSHGGYAPRIGATVWYAPGVQGASSAGHYSVVVAIGPNGWFLSADENFYWRGGGFNKVIYRYVHTGAGVDFRW